jgi:nucleoid-associated protein YgaU
VSLADNVVERTKATKSEVGFGTASKSKEPAPLGKSNNPAAPLKPDSDAADQSHTVAARESYWTIAEEKYGSGAYFRALFQYNQSHSGQAEPLQPGMRLRIPDEATLQRLYPNLCPRPRRQADAASVTRASANIAAGREYQVQHGDTLYEIARRELGKSTRWAEIYELNRDTIGGVASPLEPETTLVLPARR